MITTTVMIRIIIIVIIIINNCYQLDYMQVRRPKEARARRGAGCVVRPQKEWLILSLMPLKWGGGVRWSREMDTTMYEIVGRRSKEPC